MAHEKGVLKKQRVSDGWFQRFKERHPHFSLRRGDAMVNVRMDCLNKEIMTQYFSMLKGVLTKHNLLDSPAQIYNVNETGMPLDHRAPKVMTLRGQKKVRCYTSGNRNQITVIASVSAMVYVIPPFVIFDAKSLQQGMDERSSTWFNLQLWRQRLSGHSSHYQPELIRFQRNIT